MARPAVVFGGPSPEHDISILTGLQAARALVPKGITEAIYWSKTGKWFQVDARLEAKEFISGVPRGAVPLDLVAEPGGGFRVPARFGAGRTLEISALVNCCHGGPGEDGTLQAALDLAGIAYTGPGVAGSALGMDKLAFGGTVAAAGLPSLPRVLLTRDGPEPSFPGPYIVKPRSGGSSLGVFVVETLADARELAATHPLLRGGTVMEPYRADAVDVNISVRTHPRLQLSAIERPAREGGGAFYAYADKYLRGGGGLDAAPREMPAALPAPIEEAIRSAALVIAELVELRSVARIDYLWAGDDLWVNEVNTIPGALAWYFWAEAGTSLVELLESMIDEAETTPARRMVTHGADGTALRAAGSIANKLGLGGPSAAPSGGRD
ncbi:MAG: hypothetical protein ABIZ34_08880 [Candidatus Limnocylindrales bacterium]